MNARSFDQISVGLLKFDIFDKYSIFWRIWGFLSTYLIQVKVGVKEEERDMYHSLNIKCQKMYSSVSPRSKIKINFKERIVFTMWHLGASPLILTFAPQQIRPICHDSSINYNLTLGNQGSLSVQLTPKFTFLTQKFFFKVSFSFLFPIYLSKNCQVPIESF